MTTSSYPRTDICCQSISLATNLYSDMSGYLFGLLFNIIILTVYEMVYCCLYHDKCNIHSILIYLFQLSFVFSFYLCRWDYYTSSNRQIRIHIHQCWLKILIKSIWYNIKMSLLKQDIYLLMLQFWTDLIIVCWDTDSGKKNLHKKNQTFNKSVHVVCQLHSQQKWYALDLFVK